MKFITVILFFCILFGPSTVINAQSAMPDSVTTPTAPLAFGLPDGTPVKLRLGRTISSADARTGETIDFEVLEDIKIGELLILARGATALGTVTRAKPKARLGKGGKLEIVIDSVILVSGEKIALRANKDAKGNNYTGTMTGAIVATSILFFPAAPFFLFMKGKDITIPKGAEVTAYVNGDISLDPRNFAAPASQIAVAEDVNSVNDIKETAAANINSSISVISDPEGAEIEVDGRFVGSTPSAFQLEPGEHRVVIKKPGYLTWERTITLNTAGNIKIDAALEKLP